MEYANHLAGKLDRMLLEQRLAEDFPYRCEYPSERGNCVGETLLKANRELDRVR